MILSFDEVGDLLDQMAEELPQALFEQLNGGVGLLPDEVQDPELADVYILGEFCEDQMGRYIQLYYGSFAALAGEEDWARADWERELRETLRHELTHHIEGLAGDRSLERKDAEQVRPWRRRQK